MSENVAANRIAAYKNHSKNNQVIFSFTRFFEVFNHFLEEFVFVRNLTVKIIIIIL